MLIKNAPTSSAIVTALAIGIVCLSLNRSSVASPCYYGWIALAAINDGPNAEGVFSAETIDELRRSGYQAMDDMQSQYSYLKERLLEIDAKEKGNEMTANLRTERAKLVESRDRLETLIDQVARQRDATTSGLIWHTNIDEAIEEAQKQDKPILSLRMLGKLTDEFSCANSRFFRTTLYSNQEIAKKLRKDFVLHWKSVRPVPKITIDFGDGRTLERTITGNSAHYVLDKSGRPLDCLPGLYGPGKFSSWLDNMKGVNLTTKNLDAETKNKRLKQYHASQNMTAGLSLKIALAKIDPALVDKLNNKVPNEESASGSESIAKKLQTFASKKANPATAKRVDARRAAPIAISKSILEVPILNLAFNPDSINVLDKGMDNDKWERLAQLHAGIEKLDAASIELIKRENPTATQASALTRAKGKTEDKLTRMVESFQRSILIDTVRNEYLLHRKIHGWFSNEPPTDVDALNKRVYAELFLTPDTDPWLGLKPENVYSGLENDGVKVAAKK